MVTVIAVTGPSAAGKTTLAHALTARLPGTVHLQQDAYFRDRDGPRKRDRDRRERNKPDAVIAAQLAWMRREHAADLALRHDPSIQVLADGPLDITRLVHRVLSRTSCRRHVRMGLAPHWPGRGPQ